MTNTHTTRITSREPRHTVEIALWALKSDVVVRSIEDPYTFRDLLNAVVTGQRNHEDSKRKGSAVSAGLRRAALEGRYVGDVADGYKVEAELEPGGKVRKRLVIDPDRREVIELIFKLALKKHTPGQIARALTAVGWHTRPPRRDQYAKDFDQTRVLHMLQNPRYAGLSVHRGNVVGQGQWPSYISQVDFETLQRRIHERARGPNLKPREQYLLAGLAICDQCSRTMCIVSGKLRTDGTRDHRYRCPTRKLHRPEVWIDADVVDHAFVTHLDTVLQQARDPPSVPVANSRQASQLIVRHGNPATYGGHETVSPQPHKTLMHRIRVALIADEDDVAEELLAQSPNPPRDLGRSETSGRITRERAAPVVPVSSALLFEFYAWSANELAGRPENSTIETIRLRRLLAGWFSNIKIGVTDGVIRIELTLRRTAGHSNPSAHLVTIDTGEWKAALRASGRPHRRNDWWTDAEILTVVKGWHDEHGRAPLQREFDSTPNLPDSSTARRHFGSWLATLRAAGLQEP